ncbi:MAG: carbohydrate-binding family 9-like protein [Myxococcaceae bacterium]|nr:carbohydrate-binding family 9-like protein [Myxococcaceae bacterium]
MRLRTSRLLFTAALVAACSFLACRDEQAGPKSRAAPGPARAAPPSGAVVDSVPGDLTFRSGATFANGALEYLGSKVTPPGARPGETVTLSHYFRALRPLPQGWDYFVHVVDPASGQMLGNADHAFAGGLSLDRWPVGKVVVDTHQVTMPAGPARIVLGFWQGEMRMPIDQPVLRDNQMRALGPNLGAAAPSLPEYHAHRTDAPPVIDGALDDPAWQKAEAVVLTQSFNGSKPDLATTARLLYDDQFLYVSFDCEDPDVWGTLLQRDQPIYTQEVVEIFLDADANQRTYNELELSPNNVIFDAYFPARRQGMDTSWDSKMQTAVKVRGTLNDDSDRDEGWSAEMKIPFSTLASVPNIPPHAGDRWRFNLYRLDLPDRRTQHGQSFSPLFMGDFHNLPRFGWLIFD